MLSEVKLSVKDDSKMPEFAGCLDELSIVRDRWHVCGLECVVESAVESFSFVTIAVHVVCLAVVLDICECRLHDLDDIFGCFAV